MLLKFLKGHNVKQSNSITKKKKNTPIKNSSLEILSQSPKKCYGNQANFKF